MKQAQRQLAVEADLVVTHALGDLRITGSGERLVVDLPGVRMGRHLLQEGKRQVQPASLKSFDAMLRSVGLSVELNMNDCRVARLGKNSRPGILDKLLGTRPLQVDYSNAIFAALRGARP